MTNATKTVAELGEDDIERLVRAVKDWTAQTQHERRWTTDPSAVGL